MVLVLRPSAKCLGDVCECSDEGLHLPRLSVSDSGDEPFFPPHQPFDEVTMDDIRPYFALLRYPTNDESDSDTRLTSIASVESDPSKPFYPSYHVEMDPFELSFPSVICLSFDLASSLATLRRTSPSVRGRGFIRTRAVPHGRGRARGGGRGDAAPGGFRNGYLPPDE